MYLDILRNAVLLLKKHSLLPENYVLDEEDFEELVELLWEISPNNSCGQSFHNSGYQVGEWANDYLEIIGCLSKITGGQLKFYDVSGKTSDEEEKILRITFTVFGKKYNFEYDEFDVMNFSNDIRGLLTKWGEKLDGDFIVYNGDEEYEYYYLPSELVKEFKALEYIDENGNIESIYDGE